MAKKDKKPISKKRKAILCILCCIFFLLVVLTIAIPIIINNSPKQSENANNDANYYNYTNTYDSSKDLVDQTCLLNAENLRPSDAELNNVDMVVVSATKMIQMYDAKLKCYESANTDIYSDIISEIKSNKAELQQILSTYPGSSAQSYTTPETTTTPTYNIPDYATAPTPEPTCAEYHQKYYTEYTSKSSSLKESYNSMISSASMSCNGQGGCPAVANLKRQLEQEIATIKTQYKSNMTSVGCDPSQYVNF